MNALACLDARAGNARTLHATLQRANKPAKRPAGASRKPKSILWDSVEYPREIIQISSPKGAGLSCHSKASCLKLIEIAGAVKSHNMTQTRLVGVQSIERTIAIVRAVAQGQKDGARLVDIARQLGITKSTAHRILQALVQAGWIERDKDRGRFHPGVELYALGLAAASRHELVGLGERATSRLADQVGDTVYFQIRMGFDSICLARNLGSYPVKILTVDVGARRPLGMGAGNMAIMAFLPDDEIEAVLAANMEELNGYAAPGVTLGRDLVRAMIEDTRRHGFAFVQDLFIPGMAAVGMPIFGPGGAPVAALSVAAITGRLQEDRRNAAVMGLRHEVRVIELRLKNGTPIPRMDLAANGADREKPALANAWSASGDAGI
jgi:DNA-binding IclR family transcriptional regulator